MTSERYDPVKEYLATISLESGYDPNELLARAQEQMSGGVVEIPIIALERLDSLDRKASETRVGYFIYAYLCFRMRLENYDLLFLGKFLLGNKEEDTRKLVSSINEDPKKAVDYFSWFYNDQSQSKPITGEFLSQLEKGILRDVMV